MLRLNLLIYSAVFSVALILFGCGYRLHSRASLPFTEITLGTFENLTAEPKLQDKIKGSLTEEFAKYGVFVSRSSNYNLRGTVRDFQMTSLSEKSGITLEYRISFNADFVLEENGKKVWEIKAGLPFIVYFTAAEDMGNLISSKEMALERASRDISSQVVGALIYK